MGGKPGTCPYTRLIRRKSLIRAVQLYLIVQRTSQAEKFAATALGAIPPYEIQVQRHSAKYR